MRDERIGVDVEPAAWKLMDLGSLLRDLQQSPVPTARPRIIAIDGRAGSGKTSLAERLHTAVPESAIVHTDDFGWWETFFGWADLAIAHVLAPLHGGEAVAFRPATWDSVDRVGLLQVPARRSVVFIEGAGSARHELAPWLDGAVWVEATAEDARRRGLERDGEHAEMVDFWDRWQAAEAEFFRRDRPWERVDAIVCGTPELVRQGQLPPDAVLVAGPRQR